MTQFCFVPIISNIYLTLNAYAFIFQIMNIDFEPCIALSIRKADRVISQIYSDYLSPLSIKSTQFTVLRALHILGTTTAKQLQEALVMEQATVSRALKPLIRDGYIVAREGNDKREKVISLSKEGQALFGEAEKLWLQAQAHIRKQLGSDSEQTLLNLSNQIVSLKS